MKRQTVRGDVFLIGLLILAGLLIGLVLLLTKNDGTYVEIRVTGAETRRIPLSESGSYEIEGVNGTNVLVIENGRAHMEEASCPDGVCMGMGEIDTSGQSIICLPNEIVVVVMDASSGEEESDIDAVTGGKQS
ncbi:MAG: NusG domain II-containing protein [Lachnospiraceae bacterium]|nr:NusG domain II-containing protein [Lachnospiraceae bacterium]